MLVTTTGTLDGMEIIEYIGIVNGAGTLHAGGAVGENALLPQKRFQQAFYEAEKIMIESAEKLGADAIIGVKHSITEGRSEGLLAKGFDVNYILITVVGTAVKTDLSSEKKEQLERKKKELAETRERTRAIQQDNDRKIAETIGIDSISMIGHRFLQEIKKNGSCSALSLSKMLPRSADPGDIKQMLSQFESLDVVRRDESGSYVFGLKGEELRQYL